MKSSPDLSVIVCTYNGSAHLACLLDSLNHQSIRDRLEIVVVDDGSDPPVDEHVVARVGARLVRHATNVGLAAARNTGISASVASIVAFTDDDCRPSPDWAQSLLGAYCDESVASAGGPVFGSSSNGFLMRYYEQDQPVKALESDLSLSASLLFRLWLYCRENVSPRKRTGQRDVHSLPGANCSFRRDILDLLGGFDAGIRFGGEDEDLYYRLRRTLPEKMIRFVPSATIEHEYDPKIRDALRRSWAYGFGHARNYRKHQEWGPTVFPIPVVWLLALMASWPSRRWRLVALTLPELLMPRWVILARRTRSLEPLAYPYLRVSQEAANNLGFASGWWRFRHFPFSEGGEM